MKAKITGDAAAYTLKDGDAMQLTHLIQDFLRDKGKSGHFVLVFPNGNEVDDEGTLHSDSSSMMGTIPHPKMLEILSAMVKDFNDEDLTHQHDVLSLLPPGRA